MHEPQIIIPLSEYNRLLEIERKSKKANEPYKYPRNMHVVGEIDDSF